MYISVRAEFSKDDSYNSHNNYDEKAFILPHVMELFCDCVQAMQMRGKAFNNTSFIVYVQRDGKSRLGYIRAIAAPQTVDSSESIMIPDLHIEWSDF